MPQSDIMPKWITALTLVGIMVELVCYILLFKHLYSHDEDMLKKRRLPVGEVKKRHQKNAITFLGQFCRFVVEWTLTMGAVYTLQDHSEITYRMAIVIFLWMEFGFLSVVEVMSSQNLKNNLPHNRYFK